MRQAVALQRGLVGDGLVQMALTRDQGVGVLVYELEFV